MSKDKADVNVKIDPLVHSQMKKLAKELILTEPEAYEKAAIDFLMYHKHKRLQAIADGKDAIIKNTALG
ncbi:MAG: hypothetical protein KAR42_14825 [candidate division Zixibacteria bacterium]|nr:hypothetical protein [candidate division Zixibacteria bacterium]